MFPCICVRIIHVFLLQCLSWYSAVLLFVILFGSLCVNLMECIFVCGDVCMFNDELPVVYCVEGYDVVACVCVFLLVYWLVLGCCCVVVCMQVLLYCVCLVCCEIFSGVLVWGVYVVLV